MGKWAVEGIDGKVYTYGESGNGTLSDDRISYYLNESLNNADSGTTILGTTGSYDVVAETQGVFIFQNG